MINQHNNRIYISIIQNIKDGKQQTKLLLQEPPELLDVSSTEGAGRDIAIGATRELMQKLIAPFNKYLHLGAPGKKTKKKPTKIVIIMKVIILIISIKATGSIVNMTVIILTT